MIILLEYNENMPILYCYYDLFVGYCRFDRSSNRRELYL